MNPDSNRTPYSPYPGGSPFPPGREPILSGIIRLLVVADDTIDWTQVIIKPADPNLPQPIQVSCEGCGINMIAPEDDLRIQFIPPGMKPAGEGHIERFTGFATLDIRLHRMQTAKKFLWPSVTVNYYRGKKLLAETSWQKISSTK
jgi:hypothetical protein